MIEPLLGGHAAVPGPAANTSSRVLVRDAADVDIGDDEAELITQHVRDLGYVDD